VALGLGSSEGLLRGGTGTWKVLLISFGLGFVKRGAGSWVLGLGKDLLEGTGTWKVLLISFDFIFVSRGAGSWVLGGTDTGNW